MRRTLLLLAVLVLAAAGSALCGTRAVLAGINANHKIALHVVSHGTSCPALPTFATCSDIHTTYAGTGDIDVIPVFYDLTEYTVIEFGLTWPTGWGAMEFTRCAGDISVGGIVNSGDGMAAAWSVCQRTWSVAAGVGWLDATGPGRISLVPDPPTGDYGVVDCGDSDNRAYDYPKAICSAGVGGTSGDDPCLPTEVFNPLHLSVIDGSVGGCTHHGDSLTYALSFDNNTNSGTVHNVILADSLPDGTSFVSASSGGVYDAASHSVTWQIGTLATNATGSRTLRVRIDIEPPATMVNTCRIVGDEVPPTAATRNTDVCAFTFNPLNLSVSDGLTSGCTHLGDNLTYTLSFDNTPSTGSIHNVILVDSLPGGTGFVSASSGGVYDAGSHSVTWQIGTLASNATGLRTVKIRIDVVPPATMVNTCRIAGDEVPPTVVARNTDVCAFTYNPLNLSVSDGLTSGCTYRGDSLTYTLYFDNTPSTGTVHNIMLVDSLPGGTGFVSASSGGIYDAGSHSVTWQIGTLAAGGMGLRTVRVAVNVEPPATMVNACRIAGDEVPATTAVRSTNVCVLTFSALTLTKTAPAASCVDYQANLTYTLSYSNSPNPHAVHSLVLVDSLPAQTDFVSATGGGAYDAGTKTVTWDLGNLAAGAGGSRQVTVKVNVPLGSQFTNACQLTSLEAPPSHASKTLTVCNALYHALTLTKTSQSDCVSYGSTATYKLSYSNAPNIRVVHGVVLTDNLPSQTDFVSATGGGAYSANARTVTWSLDSLAAGASGSRQITIMVKVPPSYSFTNRCSLTSTETPATNASKTLDVCGSPGGNSLTKIAIHVKAHPTACTKGYPTFASCSAITYTYAGGGDIDILPVFFDLTQYTLTEASVIWPEADWGSGSWVRCKGDVAVGALQHSADQVDRDPQTRGFAIAWSTCQVGWSAAPGYCWLAASTPARLCLAANPPTGDMGVVDCAYNYSYPMWTGCAGVMGLVGDEPCRSTGTQPTTWGSIKAMFK